MARIMKYSFEFDKDSDSAPACIARRIKKNSKVLEFGTADGVLTEYLKTNLDCEVFGVELNDQFAEAAAKFTEKMFVGDIEEYGWLEFFEGLKFDYIIFADVLEHLKEPELAIQKASELLNVDGALIMSIPNIAHSAIILSLLDNSFDYSETGLLDRTHLRFFTKKTIEEMLENCGLHISYCYGIYLPPNKTEFKHGYSDVPKSVSDYIRQEKHREIYQYVYEVRKQSQPDKIEEFHPKAFVTISLGDEDSKNFPTVYNGPINIVNPFKFEVTIDYRSPTKAIHLVVNNVPQISGIQHVKVNGVNYYGYSTNLSEFRSRMAVNEAGLTLYLPFHESLIVKEISVEFHERDSNIDNVKDKVEGTKNINKSFIQSFLKSMKRS